LRHVGRYCVALLLVSRGNLYLVSVFPDIVKDCAKMRNLPKIFLRSFENVDPCSCLNGFRQHSKVEIWLLS